MEVKDDVDSFVVKWEEINGFDRIFLGFGAGFFESWCTSVFLAKFIIIRRVCCCLDGINRCW